MSHANFIRGAAEQMGYRAHRANTDGRWTLTFTGQIEWDDRANITTPIVKRFGQTVAPGAYRENGETYFPASENPQRAERAMMNRIREMLAFHSAT